MSPRGPCLVLCAAPGAPGAADALAGAQADSARVLLTGAGLAWLASPTDLEALRATGAELALCSQAAHARGLTAAGTPPGVRWTSLATWLAELAGSPFAWVGP
jgi:hypothetical protein